MTAPPLLVRLLGPQEASRLPTLGGFPILPPSATVAVIAIQLME
jgi:hypothetical protein